LTAKIIESCSSNYDRATQNYLYAYIFRGVIFAVTDIAPKTSRVGGMETYDERNCKLSFIQIITLCFVGVRQKPTTKNQQNYYYAVHDVNTDCTHENKDYIV